MRCGDVLSCHERILGRAKWFKKATRMESRTSKTSSRKENGCNLLQRCQFQRLKGCEANAMGWIQMFNRDQRPIFGGERTERMEMLADDCATMQLLFASLRAGETREQPLHPRLVSLHLARKFYSATKRGILFKINRSRVAAVMLHLYLVSIFINQSPNPMCRCNEPQAAPVVKEVKKA